MTCVPLLKWSHLGMKTRKEWNKIALEMQSFREVSGVIKAVLCTQCLFLKTSAFTLRLHRNMVTHSKS